MEADSTYSLRGRLFALRAARRAKRAGPRDEARARLDHYLSDSRARVLHHRTVPGGPTEIDHLIIGPAGITVVAGRHYLDGRARTGQGELRVGRRRRDDVVDSILEQVKEVRALLADTPYAGVPVEAAIAYGRVDGPPVLSGLAPPRVLVSGTGWIAGEASRPGPLSERRVNALTEFLESSLGNDRR